MKANFDNNRIFIFYQIGDENCSNEANFKAAIFVAFKSNEIYSPSEYAYFHLKAQRHHLG